MWSVDVQDLALLRDGSGVPFTKFVDALLQAHGFAHGVGEAHILTCQRTNIADGGVDTEVAVPMPGEWTRFLHEHPTCWQYKARKYAEISDAELLRELDGDYVVNLLKSGYAYRLAICDDMPAPKRAAWKELLSTHIQEISPSAPEAEIVTASQFASWANAYPSLLPAHFGFETGPALYFDAWSRNITRATPSFVPIDSWASAASLIEQHINFSQDARTAILSLQGMAGVGKTRLAHEAIAKHPGLRSLVLYASDGEDAEQIARMLANEPRTRCVLVADECPLVSRSKIGAVLKGHASRVRVVCIDNSGERPFGGDEELWLEQLEPRDAEQVLERNFPRVLVDRRRAYAELSGGYIRFAADLCEHDAEIESKGHLGPGLGTVHDYYLDRLPDDRQRRVIEAISLVQKVGFAGKVAHELEDLAKVTGLDAAEMREVAATIKDAPGFIVRTTRYLYVTPEIIAGIAFGKA